ncbi:MAG: tetratricopeptide repeat protein [Cyanobacteria bacterium J06629_2]
MEKLGADNYIEQSSYIYRNIGRMLAKLGRYEEALIDLGRAIELDPNNFNAWANRGSAKGSLGRYEDALTDYDRAIELDADNSIT